jgi:hypothetical protein
MSAIGQIQPSEPETEDIICDWCSQPILPAQSWVGDAWSRKHYWCNYSAERVKADDLPKYSTGPWIAETGYSHVYAPKGRKNIRYPALLGEYVSIADVNTYNPRREHDAVLMAAAPVLYESLVAILAEFADNDDVALDHAQEVLDNIHRLWAALERLNATEEEA